MVPTIEHPNAAWVHGFVMRRKFMSPSKIEVGKTYCNRGKGRTMRTVLEISEESIAPWFSNSEPPSEPVVRYAQNGVEERLYLSSFAAWCGREVTPA